MFPELTPPDPIPPLMSTADLRALLGLTGATEPTDAQIEFARDVATSVIRDHTGRLLSFGSYVDKFLGVVPRFQLVTSEFPIKTVSGVTVNGSPLDLANMEIRPHLGMFNLKFSSSFSEVVITYDGGYEKMPANLQAVILEFTRRQLQAMGLPTGAVTLDAPVKGVSIGNLRMDYAIAPTADYMPGTLSPVVTDVNSAFTDTLDRYRHPRILGAF
jgi:hypothetical protein